MRVNIRWTVSAVTLSLLLWGTFASSGSTPDPGTQLLNKYGCKGCHKIGGGGGVLAPDLQGIFERRDEAWIRTQIQHPRQHNPLTVMPDFGLTDDQVTLIIEALSGIKK